MLLVGIAIGLVIGWNFLAQPAWVKENLDKIKDKIIQGKYKELKIFYDNLEQLYNLKR